MTTAPDLAAMAQWWIAEAGSIPTGVPPVAELIDDALFCAHSSVSRMLSDLDDAGHRLTSGEVVAALKSVEELRRRLPAIEHRLLAQVQQRDMAADYAQASAAKLLCSQTGITPSEAKARVTAAERLGPRVALDGQELEPVLPLVAEAQQDGHLSEAHVQVITRALRHLAPLTDQATRDRVELELVGHAVDLDAHQLGQVVARVIAHLDPDGSEPAIEKAHRLRELTLYPRPDGTYRLRGDLTPHCGAGLTAVIDSLSAPVKGPNGEDDTRTPAQRRHDALQTLVDMALRVDELPAAGGVPATIIVTVDLDDLAAATGPGTDITNGDGTDSDDTPVTDATSTVQTGTAAATDAAAANATNTDATPTDATPVNDTDTDAAADDRSDGDTAAVDNTDTGLELAATTETEADADLNAESAPVAGSDGAPLISRSGRGGAPPVRGIGYAYTSHGQAWPIHDMLASIGDGARWVTVFCNQTNGVLAYGTERRYATRNQIEALIGRDHGCSFPGCQMPPQWCEAHHIIPAVPKRKGDKPGPTDLANLTLLCGYHHRYFEQAGWECLMIEGRPWWRPPTHLDPTRRPQRNTHWDIPLKR